MLAQVRKTLFVDQPGSALRTEITSDFLPGFMNQFHPICLQTLVIRVDQPYGRASIFSFRWASYNSLLWLQFSHADSITSQVFCPSETISADSAFGAGTRPRSRPRSLFRGRLGAGVRCGSQGISDGPTQLRER